MTSEEKNLIAHCRIMIVGASGFIDLIKTELQKSGFRSICIVSDTDGRPDTASADLVAEYAGYTDYCIEDEVLVPVIYTFDFVDGAGAIVIMPGDDNELQHAKDMRWWAAEYMIGYCAFWNVEGCDWLQSALPAIKEGKNNEAAMKTAIHICAKIAANIAVGREVKHFPRFYLCRNLE